MQFRFKIQEYQTRAVANTVGVFAGQSSRSSQYLLDVNPQDRSSTSLPAVGYANAHLELSREQLLHNIQNIQRQSAIEPDSAVANTHGLGACVLDIEMETGTGKTYVYIKTIHELHRTYGWSKFIIVVPSLAIREGVSKSFAILEDHFMEHYGTKARYFVYDSSPSGLNKLNAFAGSPDIHVMIINMQAFASSLKKSSRSRDSLIIYSERDSFASRKPIDVISDNRPIVIMDEPQRMEGEATQQGIRLFKPLFTLKYSATLKTKHNLVYALDALDAYEEKLVKRIQVKGFEIRNLLGTSGYLYLDEIIISPTHPPRARIELEVKRASGIKRETQLMEVKDDLYLTSNNLGQYQHFVISDINPLTDSVSFTNGVILRKGDVIGDVTELALQRVQIRETIRTHLAKEITLFGKGIKTLSLFFIDEVAKYKDYAEGKEIKGELQQIFEEEYQSLVNEALPDITDENYRRYLLRFGSNEIHNGYFSIDKKSGHVINGKTSKKEGLSDDISAFDLILKNKERLLSFDEPTRFIFSHSALREGWDNPNVFQICTLRHSNSEINKRQEVGRGLRLCVDQNGNRMDRDALGDNVHDINLLTVIANESYQTFVEDLQQKTRENLRSRPQAVSEELFTGVTFNLDDGTDYRMSKIEAITVISYLFNNGYIDKDGKVTESYREAEANDTLAPLPPALRRFATQLRRRIMSTYKADMILEDMIEDGNKTRTGVNRPTANFKRKEFMELWEQINHKYVYTVHYDSNELIKKSIEEINRNLTVTVLKYIMTEGTQKSLDSFGDTRQVTREITSISTSTVKYDLVGEIAKGVPLSRKTALAILRGMSDTKFELARNNPEEFIGKVINLIKEQKATMIVEHIGYNRIDETYDMSIFTSDKRSQPLDKAYPARKHILQYVFTDGTAENSVERRFAQDLDSADEVCVYAKLPRSFSIPTPVGNYSPDWAIAFYRNKVRHIFFVAETKGSMESIQLRNIEEAKISCAEKLFNGISTSAVRYHKVTSYQDLLDVMKGMD